MDAKNTRFLVTLVIMSVLVGVEGTSTYFDKLFSLEQMLNSGARKGLPFIAHGGMWGDFFIISPMVAFILSRYAPTWTMNRVAFVACLTLGVNIYLHHIWCKDVYPNCLGWGGYLRPAGYVHVLYMWAALVAIVLYYFDTRIAGRMEIILITSALVIHIIIANNVVLYVMSMLCKGCLAWWDRDTAYMIPGFITVALVCAALSVRTRSLLKTIP